MEAEIDIRAILGLLRRQLRLILVVFLAVTGIAAAFTFTLTPLYTATTLVMVDPSNKNLLAGESQLGAVSANDPRIEGEVMLAKTDGVLLTVIDRLNLVNDPEFQPSLGFAARVLSFLRLREPTLPTPEEALRQTLNKLGSMVTARRQGLTLLVAISAQSEDPDRASRIANAVSRAYIDSQLFSKVQSIVDARNVLVQQLQSARQNVVESEGSFDRYIETNLGGIIEQTGNTQLAEIQRQIANLSSVRQATNAELSTLQAELGNEDFSSLSQRLADEAAANLERQRQDILGQLQDGISSIAEIDLREQLSTIESELSQRARDRVASLQQELQDSQSGETALRQNLRSTILNSGLSADALTEIYDLQQQAELARQQYDQLLARSQQMQAEATLQVPDSRVVSEALRPVSASWPNIRLMLVLAGLAGLGLGVALAFVYEHFIGGVTAPDQLAGLIKSANVITVPRIKLTEQQASASDQLLTSPLSAYAESIRRIRVFLEQGFVKGGQENRAGGKVVLVTSTAPGEGKTTLALSLARSYALAGRKTLLIDGDLRRPSVHRQIGLDSGDGLVEILRAEDPMPGLSNSLVRDEASGLMVLLTPHRSDIPTDDLVSGRQFSRLIEAARKTFDVIILDTPPLGPVVDALYLARYADAVVYVVQWAETGQSEIRRAYYPLRETLADDVDIVPVLNQQNSGSVAYYRRYNGYYGETT